MRYVSITLLCFVLMMGCGKVAKDPPTIGTWSKTGPNNTDRFTVHGSSWEVEWESSDSPMMANSPFKMPSMFSVVIYRPNSTGPNDYFAIAAPPGSPQKGSYTVHGNGEFYIGVIAFADQKWAVTAKSKP